MARTPSGTITSVATVFAASKPTTGISNLAEAVVSCTAHAYVAGDIVEITSNWARLNRRAFRVKSAPTADTFVLELADTTSTIIYPPGSGAGAGTVRKVSTWVQLDKTMNHNSSGGDAKKVNYQYAESDVEFSLNDGFSAVDRTFDIDADAISTPGYAALRALTEVQTDTIIRRVAKSGATTYLPGTLAMNEEEREASGIMVCAVAISGNARSTRYPA